MFKKNLGKLGEKIARQYYQSLGWKVLIQNFYTRYGELDLVLEKNQKILIVEVKTRNNTNFGFGEESVSNKKIKNLKAAWQIFKMKNKITINCDLEICVIEIKNKKAKIYRFYL
ncbi:YraN family protein [Candidatus Nomurabacteria bacterium]|nr:YraN family protein [Candidatus Nomurabacteria bacterium]